MTYFIFFGRMLNVKKTTVAFLTEEKYGMMTYYHQHKRNQVNFVKKIICLVKRNSKNIVIPKMEGWPP